MRADACALDRSAAERRDPRTRGALAERPTCRWPDANRIPLRIDETNSVSCGGVAGVSNTFASALWATGYITQAMAAGATGINLQGNPANCAGYTPLCAPDPTALAEGRLRAQPEWYALLLTRSLIGDRPLPTTITTEARRPEGHPRWAPRRRPPAESPSGEGSSGEGSPNLVAAAFSKPDHSLKVVLVDDEPPGTSPLALRLDVGGGLGAAQILRLTAPSQGATGGVQIAGRPVAANGSWAAPKRTQSAAAHAGILALELAPGSAVLVTMSRSKGDSAQTREEHVDEAQHGQFSSPRTDRRRPASSDRIPWRRRLR